MWMYSGTEDTTQVHPEEVDDATLERWMTSITGNKDNPPRARRIPPLGQSYEPDKVRSLFRLFSACIPTELDIG